MIEIVKYKGPIADEEEVLWRREAGPDLTDRAEVAAYLEENGILPKQVRSVELYVRGDRVAMLRVEYFAMTLPPCVEWPGIVGSTA